MLSEENVLIVSNSVKSSSWMLHNIRKLFPVQAIQYAGLTMVKIRGLCLIAIARKDRYRLNVFSQCSHGRALAVDKDVEAFKKRVDALDLGAMYDVVRYSEFEAWMRVLAKEWKGANESCLFTGWSLRFTRHEPGDK